MVALSVYFGSLVPFSRAKAIVALPSTPCSGSPTEKEPPRVVSVESRR
jgi:hypothetical protein